MEQIIIIRVLSNNTMITIVNYSNYRVLLFLMLLHQFTIKLAFWIQSFAWSLCYTSYILQLPHGWWRLVACRAELDLLHSKPDAIAFWKYIQFLFVNNVDWNYNIQISTDEVFEIFWFRPQKNVSGANAFWVLLHKQSLFKTLSYSLFSCYFKVYT